MENPPVPVLGKLTRFAAKYCTFATLARINIVKHEQVDNQGRPTYGGLAGRKGGSYSVTIGLDERVTYPRTQRLNFRTPEVTLNDTSEEFLLVLAHELRHIDQFVLRSHSDPLEAEVDAETFAVAVLDAYRASLGDKRDAA